VATTIGFAAPIALVQRRNHRERLERQRSPLLSYGLWAVVAVSVLANLANTLGIPAGSVVGPYLLGLWLTLAVSGIPFVTMVFGFLS